MDGWIRLIVGWMDESGLWSAFNPCTTDLSSTALPGGKHSMVGLFRLAVAFPHQNYRIAWRVIHPIRFHSGHHFLIRQHHHQWKVMMSGKAIEQCEMFCCVFRQNNHLWGGIQVCRGRLGNCHVFQIFVGGILFSKNLLWKSTTCHVHSLHAALGKRALCKTMSIKYFQHILKLPHKQYIYFPWTQLLNRTCTFVRKGTRGD